MAEDEDIELDSEQYRKWRSGDDNDKYASSKTPTETGSKSGSYTIPKDDDEYALPGEGGGKSWLDSDLNWPMIIAVFVIFAIVASAIVAFAISSGESGSNPSEWPETEGNVPLFKPSPAHSFAGGTGTGLILDKSIVPL